MENLDFIILTVLVSICFGAFCFGLLKNINSGNQNSK
jgi:hypothetical protein